MKYKTPEMTVLKFNETDIITQSFGGSENGTEENEPGIQVPGNDWT